MFIKRDPEASESGGGGAAVADSEPVDAVIESQDSNGNPDQGILDDIPSDDVPPDEGQQQAEAPAQASFAPDLLYRAYQSGIGPDEVGQFSNAGELERAINLIARRAQNSQQKNSGQNQQAEEIKVEDIPDLGEEQATPEVIASWKAMKGAIGALQSQIASMRGGFGAQQLAAEIDRFDSRLATLPDSEALFGKGSEDTLDRNSPQYANRTKLFHAVRDVRKLAQGRGERIGEAEVFKRARNLAFGDQIAKATTQALQKNLKAQATQFTVPPTQRKIASEDPKKRAVANVTATMKKKGVLGR